MASDGQPAGEKALLTLVALCLVLLALVWHVERKHILRATAKRRGAATAKRRASAGFSVGWLCVW